MTHKRDLLSPASVLARVRSQARPGQSVKHTQILFVRERFLARLALSRYREAFVLIGGILLFLRESTHWARPTENIDLLARNLPAKALGDVRTFGARQNWTTPSCQFEPRGVGGNRLDDHYTSPRAA